MSCLVVTYAQIKSGGYAGWRRFLDTFRRLSKKSKHQAQVMQKIEMIGRLKKRIDQLEAQRAYLHAVLRKECGHPVRFQQVRAYGREDDYGCYQSGMDYEIECTLCDRTLASFSSEDEEHPEKWEVRA